MKLTKGKISKLYNKKSKSLKKIKNKKKYRNNKTFRGKKKINLLSKTLKKYSFDNTVSKLKKRNGEKKDAKLVSQYGGDEVDPNTVVADQTALTADQNALTADQTATNPDADTDAVVATKCENEDDIMCDDENYEENYNNNNDPDLFDATKEEREGASQKAIEDLKNNPNAAAIDNASAINTDATTDATNSNQHSLNPKVDQAVNTIIEYITDTIVSKINCGDSSTMQDPFKSIPIAAEKLPVQNAANQLAASNTETKEKEKTIEKTGIEQSDIEAVPPITPNENDNNTTDAATDATAEATDATAAATDAAATAEASTNETPPP